MADINKFTTKEVLNKVLLDSSGDAVAAFSHTTQEALNAVLDTTNNRLNVSIAGGTISGDVTISGDLTVTGSNTYAYDEAIDGDIYITDSDVAHGMTDLGLTTTVGALKVRHATQGGLNLQGLTDASNTALTMVGIIGVTDPTDTVPAVILQSGKKSGTSGQALAAAETVLRVDNWDSAGLVTVLGDGSFGIGIATPTSVHHVNNSGATAGWTHYTNTSTGTTANDGTHIGTNGTDTYIWNRESASIYLGTNATTRMKIDDNSRISLSNNDSGESNNTVFGKSAFNVSGDNGSDYNTAVGELAMGTNAVSGSTYNVALGYKALTEAIDCDFNIAIGANSMLIADSGESNNISIGTNAMNAIDNSGSDYNVVIGDSALLGGTGIVQKNIAIGANAMGTGVANNDQEGTIAIGHDALIALTSGAGNVAIGYQSGKAITTGGNNVAAGYNAMLEHQTGAGNVVIGKDAMFNSNNHAAAENVFIGIQSGGGNWAATANYNVGVGSYTLMGAMNGGQFNTAVGQSSLRNLTEGDDNVGIGFFAGTAVTTGSKNICIGKSAGAAMDTQSSAVLIGWTAGQNINDNDASNTVAIGGESLQALTTGQGNVGVGAGTLYYEDDGDFNTALGHHALATQAGTTGTVGNTAVGYKAGKWLTTAIKSTFIGCEAGQGIQATKLTGDDNIAIGYQAGLLLQGAANTNTIIGSTAGADMTSGSSNILIGSETGHELTTATNNVAIGKSALDRMDGAPANNVAIGGGAMHGNLSNVAISGCVAIGHEALEGTLTTGADNTVAIGKEALKGLTSGARSVAIGYQAGLTASTIDYTTIVGFQAGLKILDSESNTLIGYTAGYSLGSDQADSNVFIGTSAGASGDYTNTNNNTANTNIGIGKHSMGGYQGTDGSNTYDFTSYSNVAIGHESLKVAKSAYSNTAVGFQSMTAATTAAQNTVMGYEAGHDITSGARSVFVGYQAGDKTNSSENVAVGYQALGGSGVYNSTCVGYLAGTIMTGGFNVAVGSQAASTTTSGTNNTLIGRGADTDNATDSYQVKIGMNGIVTYKTCRVTLSTYTGGGGWTDNDAASTALFSIPQYSHISKVWVKVRTLSAGTCDLNISMGTASDEAVGDSIAGRVELLGNSPGTGINTRSQATQNANSDINASSDDNVGMVWIADISPSTTNSDGWCDSVMYVYVACANTGNSDTDPGADTVLDIGVEYY